MNLTSLGENISEENSVIDELFHLSDEDYTTVESEDEDRDILNSSKDPLKSSKIIVLVLLSYTIWFLF